MLTEAQVRNAKPREKPRKIFDGGGLYIEVAPNDRRLNSRATPPRHLTNARILRLPQVCSVTGYGRSMIYQMEAEHRFPRRIKLGERAVGWLESEVQEWVQQRIDSSRGRVDD